MNRHSTGSTYQGLLPANIDEDAFVSQTVTHAGARLVLPHSGRWRVDDDDNAIKYCFIYKRSGIRLCTYGIYIEECTCVCVIIVINKIMVSITPLELVDFSWLH